MPSPKRISQASWVPSEVRPARAKDPARKRAGGGGGEKGRWVPGVVKRAGAPTRASNGDGPGNRRAPARRVRRRVARRRRLPKRASPHRHWLILRLRRAKRRVAERDEEIERLRERVAELEEQVTRRSREKRPRAGKSRRSGGRIDLNVASFDELRTLGLTASQSERLISHRDANGGFDSVDEIEQLPGFGKATLELLRSRAHADGS